MFPLKNGFSQFFVLQFSEMYIIILSDCSSFKPNNTNVKIPSQTDLIDFYQFLIWSNCVVCSKSFLY